jgi:(p)ppGpp synthase/HD superfamily hydrolase
MPADEKLTNPLSDRFNEALVYAATLHRDQARKGTQIPYVSHLLAVAALVIENGGNEAQAIAALLHDAFEDQGIDKADEIRSKFGEAVLAVVMACTDATVPKGVEKPPWRERKESYIERVEHEPAAMKLVSAADKLHNARAILADYRDLGEKLWERFNGGKDGTLWYYRSLVEAFRGSGEAGGLRRLVEELDRVVSDLERLARVKP